jgi:hypothetical protein
LVALGGHVHPIYSWHPNVFKQTSLVRLEPKPLKFWSILFFSQRFGRAGGFKEDVDGVRKAW